MIKDGAYEMAAEDIEQVKELMASGFKENNMIWKAFSI
jgi:hypothetical protein